MTSAQQRIARANQLAATRYGRPTAHCDDCGRLECAGHEVPEQRRPTDDMTFADRLGWERSLVEDRSRRQSA